MSRKPGQPARRGRPPATDPPKAKGRSPGYVVYARINPELGRQWDKLLGKTRRTQVQQLEIVLEEFLAKEGLWPPPTD